MDRTACVDLPAFPLQLLLRAKPDWAGHPAAVVEEDKPQGRVLWVNERARAAGVLPGMRYAAALSLARGLRAAVVPESEIRDAVATIAERLRQFTPFVEPAHADPKDACALGEPGVYWLDARGLERLFGSVSDWSAAVQADLVRAGYRATLVVGWSRFGTFALARARRGVHLLACAEDECLAARTVPLDRLALPPRVRDTLAKLAVRTVGAFLDLPLDGVGVRFGPDVRALHRLAAGDLALPVQPEHPDLPATRRILLDHPESDAGRVVAMVAELLDGFLDEIGHKARALAELALGFRFERLGDHVERIRPASPTLDAKLLLELVRLRLEAVRTLPDAVMEVLLVASETEATVRQRELFAERKRRDLDAANRALARVRARLGENAVRRARLRDGHLPEARFAWEPLATLSDAHPRGAAEPRLVRRIQVPSLPLPPRERHEPDGWMLRGLEQGPVTRVLGPYTVSGGWWNRPVHRDYHFAETKDGELLWVYYDRMRRRWFQQGRVE